MQQITLDCQQVQTLADFYRLFSQKFNLGCGFGANLDALWDVLTGEISLPVHITLRHVRNHPCEADLRRIIAVMEQAVQETEGAFSVRVKDPQPKQ